MSLELIHSNSREGRSSVVLGLVLVHFVNRDGCVDDRGLDSLLLHDRLDVFVHVVVDVLSRQACICCC